MAPPETKSPKDQSDSSNNPIAARAQQINALFETDPDEATWQAIVLCAKASTRGPNAAERTILSKATPSSIQVDDATIQVYTFTPPNAPADVKTVLFTTGFGITLSSMLPFAQPLLAKGYRVVLFDQVGHGESTGPYWRISTQIKTIEVLARQNPLTGLVGFSAGGTIASYVLWKNRIECPAVVCLNPPLQIITVMRAFLKRTGMKIELLDRAVEVAKAREFVLVEHLMEEMSQSSEGMNARILVTCDDADKVAGLDDCRWFAKRLGAKDVLTTHGLGHYGCLKSKDVAQRVVDFVTNDPGKRTGKI